MSKSSRARNHLRRQMLQFLKKKGIQTNGGIGQKNKDLATLVANCFGVALLPGKKQSDTQIAELLSNDFLSRIQRNALPKARVATSKPTKRTSDLPTKLVTPSERTGFYWSDEWRALRYRALKLHGGCCQCCGERPSPGKPLHVDHIKPRSKYPELELDINNLQVLCADCNLGKSAWDETDWRGNVVQLRKA